MIDKVIKYEQDDIDTDSIIPGKYLKVHDYDELAKHAMEGLDPLFNSKVKSRHFIVAGKNFGCGSSREHASISLSRCGIKAILAPSFSRIFYRNSIDGAFLLPIEIDEQSYFDICDNDQLSINITTNEIINMTKNTKYRMKPFSKIINEIISVGGLFKLNKH